MQRTNCGGCGGDRLEVFLDLGSTPLADRFPATPDEPEDTWPLELAVCRACWLVQLTEVVPDEVLWANYGFYSGASPSKVAEHKALAADLLAAYPDQAKRLTVEIACNDGDLLRHFADAGCEAVGVDPAEGPVEVARDLGLDVLAVPFGRAAAAQVRSDYDGPAGLVIARNVAAHVADLHDFFGGIADLLAPDGVAVVEVQYLADLLAGNQFDHVYHEHRFFFSSWSLQNVCWSHGLQIERISRVPAQGGSIRVEVRHKRSHQPIILAAEYGYLDQMATYQSFQGRVEHVRDRLNGLLAGELAGASLAGYGATAKSTTLLNFCGIGPETLEYVEDLTPAKIGRYTPGTHIPIVAPGDREPPDVYLLLAWNYLSGVIHRERAFLEHGGQFLVPIPVPVLL